MKKPALILGAGKTLPAKSKYGIAHSQEIIWMTDLKKAGERVEFLWSKKHRKGDRENG
jgi:hypothetical protein